LDNLRIRPKLCEGAHVWQVGARTLHALKLGAQVGGYSSSSLRERLYVDVNHLDFPTSGVLIYTVSGHADGAWAALLRGVILPVCQG
jgi:hypothetical protein